MLRACRTRDSSIKLDCHRTMDSAAVSPANCTRRWNPDKSLGAGRSEAGLVYCVCGGEGGGGPCRMRDMTWPARMKAPKLRHSHLGGFFRFTQSTTPAPAPGHTRLALAHGWMTS